MELQTECELTSSEPIQNTSQSQNDQQANEQPTSTKPTDSEQRTDHGAGASSQYFTLLDLQRITFTLDGVEVLNAESATNEQFGAMVDILATVSNVKEWFLEERRDFLNGLYAFCQQRNYPFPFVIADEETTPPTPTAPLAEHNQAESTVPAEVPGRTEEAGFLHDVERARPVITAHPTISSQELAQALGWSSALYAHTVKVFVNAHREEEA